MIVDTSAVSYLECGIVLDHQGDFGDCLSYALALDTREPLLWKGDDFGHTGIASALTR